MRYGEISKTAQQNLLETSAETGSSRHHHRPGMDWVRPLEEVNQVTTPAGDGILIGPSDHYNVGGMLRPHVLARALNLGKFRCASLVSADMTAFGGHSVRNYGESALEMTGSRLQLIHLGGNQITEKLIAGFRSAVSDEERDRFESLSLIGGEAEMATYVKRRSGQIDDLAYVLAAEGEFYGASLSFHGIGLADPAVLSEAEKECLLETMRQANFVGVIDETGAAFLESEGISARKMPCPLTILPQVAARRLREHRDCLALEELRHRFPNGWIAVEVGRVCPADQEPLSAALREVAERENLGLVFFEATSEAPGEDSPWIRSWVDCFPEWIAAAFASSNIWDVTSLLLHSRLYCGSDLDCRIISMSGGIARINIPTGTPEARSYCELWEHDEVPIEFSADEDWRIGLEEALEVDLSVLQQHSLFLHEEYMEALAEFCEATGVFPRLTAKSEETMHARVNSNLHHLHDEWLSDEESLQRFRKLNRRSAAKRLRKAVGKKLRQVSQAR